MSPPPSATRRGSNNNSTSTSNSNGTSEDYNIELGSQEQVLPDATGSTIAGTTNGTTIDTGKAPLFLYPHPPPLALSRNDIISSYLLLGDLRLQLIVPQREREGEKGTVGLSIVKYGPIKRKKQLWGN